MNISLTPEQERFIQTQIEAGTYHSAEEVLDVALRLLAEYNRADPEWVEEIREKVDAAIATSSHTPPVDGEAVISQILERFQQLRSSES